MMPDPGRQTSQAGIYLGECHCGDMSTHAERDAEAWVLFARELGLELNRRRHAVGLTQERLAYAAGLTRYHYQQLEKGQSKPGTPANPSLRNVLALAQALGTNIAELLPINIPDLTEGK